jgi:hypothetical protein
MCSDKKRAKGDIFFEKPECFINALVLKENMESKANEFCTFAASHFNLRNERSSYRLRKQATRNCF